jgi:SOS response regulatory protein OraA/RecX
MDEAHARLYAAAIFYLKFRRRTKKELSVYLHKKMTLYGIAAHIEDILERLQIDKYINDEEFTEWYVSNKLGKGYGVNRIRLELKRLGIEDFLIQKYCKIEPTDDYILSLVKKVSRRYTLHSNDQKETQKAYAFLLRRGVEYSVVKKVIQQAIHITN